MWERETEVVGLNHRIIESLKASVRATSRLSCFCRDLLSSLFVLSSSQPPGRLQSTRQNIFADFGQDDMGRSHSAPAASDGNENIRKFFHKGSLLFWRKHQVAVTLPLSGERGENSATDTEVWRAHVRALVSAFKAESDSAKIVSSHAKRDAVRVQSA